MPATINGGAAAPGPVTPTSDNAHLAVGAVFKGQGETDNPDCADYLAGDQPGARPHQRRDRLKSGRPAQNPRRDTVMTGRVSNAPDGAGVSAPGFATLAAQLALAGGHVLTELSDGSFMVSRWGQTRHCSDLHAVAQFAKRLGVKP